MKASELIKELIEMIAEDGDRRVTFTDRDGFVCQLWDVLPGHGGETFTIVEKKG